MARDNYSSRDPYARGSRKNYIQWWLLDPKNAVPWNSIINHSDNWDEEWNEQHAKKIPNVWPYVPKNK